MTESRYGGEVNRTALGRRLAVKLSMMVSKETYGSVEVRLDTATGLYLSHERGNRRSGNVLVSSAISSGSISAAFRTFSKATILLAYDLNFSLSFSSKTAVSDS